MEKNIMNMLLHIEISSNEILLPRSFYWNTFFSREKKKKNDSARENSYELSVLRNSRIDEVSMLETLESSIFEIFKFLSSPTFRISKLSDFQTTQFLQRSILKLRNFQICSYANFQISKLSEGVNCVNSALSRIA